MRFLIFGDVVGAPGRAAVSAALPALREEFSPDSVIINIENIAHGSGISPATMQEALAWRADAYTSGDHAWDNKKGLPLLSDPHIPLIRPANYPTGVPGRGYLTYTSGAWRVAVINLQGQVFFKNDPDNPFHALDRLLEMEDIRQADMILVDFHSEATSEARAFGWHADGRVSAVWGTHTHVPTADAQVLPGGTGYISDAGMQGAHHSVIGASRALVQSFLTQLKMKFDVEENGPLEVNAVVIDVDPRSGHATDIQQVRRVFARD
ncbi:MAG: metallophosphoesterase [Candidatus Magasanikbacteria bacterium CG10_big_fil_rev_8_21_14_0_10_47_10]|uniref:Metallophosphoesterase n=1 Tax=Candidatus Magasanikbacteria bacterium CG10_big_fil_rev_8_21_14_0_10_47_10 TaxID=1974652 RepID=A0A2H0TRH2_9BACT|nr:MAG: metallophosphoesterase [Candidatus Magasanikbacteria bacterium CG10_big_fil_rev_8_21_14_0_10_47_10]